VIAEANAPAWEARFTKMRASLPPSEQVRLDHFMEVIQQRGAISINMRPSVLRDFLQSEKYLNIYEWCAEQARLSGRVASQIFAEKLGAYHVRRLAFDALLTRANQFRYGALSIGGLGAQHYGQFCTALRTNFPERCPSLAYLWGDSLNSYTDPLGNIDEPALCAGAADHIHRHLIGALKHGSHACKAAESEWAGLLFADSDIIEAVFIADVSLAAVEEVRIAKADYQQLWDLAFADYGRKLKDAELALAFDFVKIRRAEVDARIRLTRC